jgi:DNA invertase Pin-like site-specific DNA recombinase
MPRPAQSSTRRRWASRLDEPPEQLAVERLQLRTGVTAVDPPDNALTLDRANEVDDDVNRRLHLLPYGGVRQIEARHQRHGLNAPERVGGRARVNRRERPVVPGVHRLEHVERLAAAYLADHDAIRSHAQRVPYERAQRDLSPALDIRGPRLEARDVMTVQAELCSVLDCHDPLSRADEGGERVQERRLPGSCAAGDDDVHSAPDSPAEERNLAGHERAEIDQVGDAQRLLRKPPDGEQRAVERQRREHGVHAAPVWIVANIDVDGYAGWMQSPVTADGYVRVSRRAGREGESFISPDVQRKKITEWGRLHGVEVVNWWEEIDQSGAKLARPMFQEALARCERGETGGIIVARLDRFARSAVDALESIKRLNQAGARLVSVEDNFDGSTAMGRFAIGILTLIAELELERIKTGWATAVSEAVARGVHISPWTPTGYRRDSSRRLLPEEPAASVVAEVFRRRAVGASYTDLARFLEAKGVSPPTGNPHWSTTGVAGLLQNPVYLGQARSGSITKEGAHEPLVSRAEWDAAQTSRTVLQPRHTESVAAQALLGGLIRCAGCGHTLKISASPDRGDGRYPTYYCRGRYASGLCQSRATIRAAIGDEYVEQEVL